MKLDGYEKKFFCLKNVIIIILALTVICEFFLMGNNKIKSDTDDDEISVSIEEIIETVTKNVVGISKTSNVDAGKTEWGSGVVISKKGYILTNQHIVGNKYEKCDVLLGYNDKYTGDVVWANTQLDLAIIKINYEFEDCAILGSTDEVKVGQTVYAIGNPIGISFEKSVTSGIVSGLNRSLEFEENGENLYINNLIQTDATINPGNSGGALINSVGQLIGITTIKISSAESMSFAVPTDVVNPILDKLNNEGEFKEPTLEISVYDKYSIKEVNTSMNLESGVYVTQINLNSNSELAGLKIGDIILSCDGKEIDTTLDLIEYLYEKNPSDIVTLKIRRDKTELKIDVKLARKF